MKIPAETEKQLLTPTALKSNGYEKEVAELSPKCSLAKALFKVEVFALKPCPHLLQNNQVQLIFRGLIWHLRACAPVKFGIHDMP